MSACLLALWLLAVPAASDWTPVERIVAVVDDDLVLASELDRRVVLAERELARIADAAARARAQTELRRTTLAGVIDELLIAHEAARIRVEVTDSDVDAAVAMIKSYNNLDDAAFARALADAGQTPAEHRAATHAQLLRLKLFMLLFRDRITISDADVEAAYRAEKAKRPELGELAAESERLRAALQQQVLNRESERWLAEARGRAQIELRP